MSDNCHNGHFKRGPTYGTGFLGSEGPSGVFAPEPEKDIRPSSPPSGASRVRLGHGCLSVILPPGRIAFLAGHIAFQGVDRR